MVNSVEKVNDIFVVKTSSGKELKAEWCLAANSVHEDNMR